MYTNKYSHLGITLSHKLHAGLVNELLRSANYDCNTVWSQWSSLNVFSRLLNILRFTVLFSKPPASRLPAIPRLWREKCPQAVNGSRRPEWHSVTFAWYHSWKSLKPWMGNTLWVISAVQHYSQSHQPCCSRPFHDFNWYNSCGTEKCPLALPAGMALGPAVFWEWPVTKEQAALWIALVSDHLERRTWAMTLLGPTLHTDFRNPFQSCFNLKTFFSRKCKYSDHVRLC